MKKKYCVGLMAGLLFCIQYAIAQHTGDTTNAAGLHSFLKFKAGDIAGFEWEQKIGQKSVITFFAGVSFGFPVDGFQIPRHIFQTRASSIVYVPAAYVEYRHYYNLGKRTAQKKNTYNNAASFVYGRIENFYPQKNQNYFGLLFVQGWGKQLGLGKRGLWKKIIGDCHLGVAEHFYYDKPPSGGFNYVKIEPYVAGTVSYVF